MRRPNTGLPHITRTLAEVAQALSGTDQPAERARAALQALGKLLTFDRAALLVSRRGQHEMYAIPALSAAEIDGLRARLAALLRLMEDSAADTEPAAADDPRRVHLAVPVLGLDHVIGVLYVERARGLVDDDRYDEDSLRLLSVAAAQLGSYLTALHLREEELEHARELGMALQRLEETDRRKDEFLAMLGHELRNPLGAIHTALRVLDQGSVDDIARYHQLIDRQIRHLSRIVDDLLDASRVRLDKIVLERRPVDLRDVAERWLESFGPTPAVQSHDLQLTVPPQAVIVEGDAVRLEQVFSNLLTNALKYTPHGGLIQVDVRAEGEHAVLRVRDHGIGMTPHMLSAAFELFTQADDSLARSHGGLGLGLPLVRSLVEKHGGTVDAFSEGVGKGTELVVRLPLMAAASCSDASSLPPDVALPVAKLLILVVEDNVDSCDMLRHLLEIWGHAVDSAGEGHEAVAKALAGAYDAALVDIGLPGLDGYQVARRLRSELLARAPYLVAMTGYGQPEDRRRAMDAGFDAHLVKPIDHARLRGQISAAAARKTGAPRPD